jgi:hypothetical protein
MRGLTVAAAAIFAVATASDVFAQYQIVSTYPQWSGTSAFAQMGEQPSIPGTEATWGQTLTAPITAPILKQFSVSLSDSPAFEPDPLKFRGYLMEWNGTRALGTILYQSPTQTADGMSHGEFRRFDMGPIDQKLDPAKEYVFFISCSMLFDGVDSWAYVAGSAADNYPGGYLVTLNNQNNASMWTNTDWQITGQWDMTFEAIFDVPEPGAALALIPIFGIMIGGRRKPAAH